MRWGLWVLGVVLLGVLGCSGGVSFTGGDGMNEPAVTPILGDAEFRYRWSLANAPTSTPPAFFSIELFDDRGSVGVQRIARDGTDLAIVRLRDLRTAHYLFVARTFAADNRVLMEGWGGVSLRHGSALVILTQETPPILMHILPEDPLVGAGRSVRLAAMLRTEQGSVVLLPPNAITWSSASDAVRVDAPGRITAFRSGQVTARLNGSVLDASTEVHVPGIAGARGKIVFVLDHDGFEVLEPDGDFNHDLWFMFANGNGLRRLTFHHAREIEPALSPDGLWVAFASNRDSGAADVFDIFQLPLAGGETRRLVLDGRRPQFLDHGKTLAFTRFDGLFTFPVAGGAIRRLFANAGGQFSEFRVCFDGALLFLSVHEDPFGGRDLFRCFPDDFSPTRLTFFNTNDGLPSPFMMHAPAPCPNRINAAFAWGRTGSSGDIFLIDLDGRHQHLLHHTEEGSVERIIFSPNGDKLLFDTGQNRAREFRQLWVLDADGGNERLVCKYAFWGDWVE